MSNSINTKIKIDLFELESGTATSISSGELKKRCINLFVRNFAILGNDNCIILLSTKQIIHITTELGDERSDKSDLVEGILSLFLQEVVYLLRSMRTCKIRIGKSNIERKVRIYLHKLHRIVPIFNYHRARTNLKILHRLFYQKNYWPSFSTQLALVIYITDKLVYIKKPILQKNIRTICNCSAYAFHRAKNRLEIDSLIKKE